MSTGRVKLWVSLPPEEYDRIYQHAQASGATMSGIAREAIAEKLDRCTAEKHSMRRAS